MANSDFLEVVNVGFSPKPTNTKIVFAQLEFKSEDYKKDEETDLWILVDEGKVKKYIEKVLQRATEEQANLVVFPELSVPEKYLGLIEEWCNEDKDAKRVAVAGSHYYKNSANKYISRCPVVFFGGIEYTEKINPSPYEKPRFLGKGCSAGTQIKIFRNTPVGNLAVLICMDYMVDDVRVGVLKKDIDILCVVSRQNESSRYFKQMDLDCRSVEKGIYILYANTKINNDSDGKSAVFGINPNLTGSNNKNQEAFEHKAFELETDEYAIVEVDLSNKRVSFPYNHNTKPNFRYDLKEIFTNKSIQPKATPNVGELSEQAKQAEHIHRKEASRNEKQIEVYAEQISSLIFDQRIIFFVGDTVSWDESLGEMSENNHLISETPLTKHLKEVFGNDLIKSFGKQFVSNNLAHLSQQICIAKNKDILNFSLITFFEQNLYVDPIYKWLSEIAEINKTINEKIKPSLPNQRMLVVLSSSDNTLEKLLKEKKIPFHLLLFVQREQAKKDSIIHYDAQGKEINLPKNPSKSEIFSSDNHPIILKIYGDLDKVKTQQSSLIVTEDDYINLAGKNLLTMLPAPLNAIFMQNKSLFIKYNVSDWNLRVILFRVWQAYRSDNKGWAITNNSRQGDKELWENFGMDLINNQDILMFMDKIKEKIKLKAK